MHEVVKFVHHGADAITPRILKNIHKHIPLLKMEFTQMDDPKVPHLVDQLEFLADLIEDFAEGVELDVPYCAIAEAAFALIYAHRRIDLIPEFVHDFGHVDDSVVVRCALIENERSLALYAAKQWLNWKKITTKP